MLSSNLRPNLFDEVVGQEYIVNSIKQQSLLDKFFNVYILSGQFGSGKTTIARIIALASNCEHKHEGNPCLDCDSCKSILNESNIDFMEIDGASNNGIDQVRAIINNSSHYSSTLKYKVFIIDEVHMLSKAAFNALLKTLEEPPSWCIFILCTTEEKSIPETVRSRAARYKFVRIPTVKIINHIQSVANKLEISVDNDALALIAKYSNGAMRNALNLLDQCSSFNKIISSDIVMNLIGIESVQTHFYLLNSIVQKDNLAIINICNSMYDKSVNLKMLLSDLMEIISDATIYLTTGDEKLISNTEDYLVRLKELCTVSTLEQLFNLSNELLIISQANDHNKSTIIVSFIRITSNLNIDHSSLISRISLLENTIEKLSKNYQYTSNSSSDIEFSDKDNNLIIYSDSESDISDENIDYSFEELDQYDIDESQIEAYEQQMYPECNNNIDYDGIESNTISTFDTEESMSINHQDRIENKTDEIITLANSETVEMQSTNYDSNESSLDITNMNSIEHSNVSSFNPLFILSLINKNTIHPLSESTDNIETSVPDLVKEDFSKGNLPGEVLPEEMIKTAEVDSSILLMQSEYSQFSSIKLISAALKTCTIDSDGLTTTISTKLYPIFSILKKYIETYNYSTIKVVKI